jgi:dephospho-CoA kinase
MKIGLTGNIGAGKTTVAREFERLGVPVYYADLRAKELMESDAALVGRIRDRFGNRMYSPTGKLRREALAADVFTDPQALGDLNALVHPAVARDATEWHDRQASPYTLHEAAIILEIGGEARYTAMVVVTAPVEVRAHRVQGRDGASREQFEQRAARQWTEERKAAAADYLIVNDGNRLLLPQVLAVDRQLRKRAAHLSRG